MEPPLCEQRGAGTREQTAWGAELYYCSTVVLSALQTLAMGGEEGHPSQGLQDACWAPGRRSIHYVDWGTGERGAGGVTLTPAKAD